jgi:hypothetical protein
MVGLERRRRERKKTEQREERGTREMDEEG